MASQTFLPTMTLDEPAAISSRNAILVVLTANLVAPAALLASFDEFSNLVSLDVGDFMAEWKARTTVDLKATVAELERLDQVCLCALPFVNEKLQRSEPSFCLFPV